MKNKTLKDLKEVVEIVEEPQRHGNLCVRKSELKQLTIKCIKEDKKVLKIIHPTQYKVFDGLTKLWMERLDITEEDLI